MVASVEIYNEFAVKLSFTVKLLLIVAFVEIYNEFAVKISPTDNNDFNVVVPDTNKLLAIVAFEVINKELIVVKFACRIEPFLYMCKCAVPEAHFVKIKSLSAFV
jgi:hypothetical protein